MKFRTRMPFTAFWLGCLLAARAMGANDAGWGAFTLADGSLRNLDVMTNIARLKISPR